MKSSGLWSLVKQINAVQCFILLIFISGGLSNCGGEETSESNSVENSTDDTINTDKLVGTPFEGFSNGDSFNDEYFLCGDFRTETVESLPIKIFAAFFTLGEEETIQEGIDLANDAMGITAYELTDIWEDFNRVISKVTLISDDSTIGGQAHTIVISYNTKRYSDIVVPDWQISLSSASTLFRYVVAHELGHASGIQTHALIDYENDSLTDLEPGSLMEATSGTELGDYDFMMNMQGQIMQSHLEESGLRIGGLECP